MTFGRGARRSHPSKLARAKLGHPAIAQLLGAIPSSADLSPHAPSILDQDGTGSCTAHSICAGVATAAAVAGVELALPSPDVEYKVTRGLERALAAPASTLLVPLTDDGAELADAIWAMATAGVCPMGAGVGGRHSDVDPATVNDEADLARLEEAATTIVTGDYRIEGSGQNLSDQVAAALAAGFPVYVGFFVDSAFEALQPGQVAGAPDQNDPNGGGHAVILTGFSTAADGTRTFTLRNSWGAGWCNGGTCLVGQAWLDAAWEFWVLDVTVKKGAAS